MRTAFKGGAAARSATALKKAVRPLRVCAFLAGRFVTCVNIPYPHVIHNLYTKAQILTGTPSTRMLVCNPPMTTTKELWENALVELELTISKPNFNTWFKDTHIVRIEEGTVALGVPSQFARDWLSTKFHKDILRSLRGLSESVRTVEYVISRGVKKTAEEPARVVPPPTTRAPLRNGACQNQPQPSLYPQFLCGWTI